MVSAVLTGCLDGEVVGGDYRRATKPLFTVTPPYTIYFTPCEKPKVVANLLSSSKFCFVSFCGGPFWLVFYFSRTNLSSVGRIWID